MHMHYYTTKTPLVFPTIDVVPGGTCPPQKEKKFGMERTLISISPILRGQVPKKKKIWNGEDINTDISDL